MVINKHLLKPVIQVFLFVNVMFFVSCSDDTVTPIGYQFDPPRYEWTADTVFADIYNMWAFDTNNIYFQDPFKLVYYNGSSYRLIEYSSNILAYTIDGYDKFNVFIGGLDRTTANLNKPKVIKWDGAVFEDFFLGDSVNTHNSIISIKSISQYNVWMGTHSGRIYNYNNGIIRSYYFDTNMVIGSFFKDETNNLYFAGDIIYENIPNADSSKTFIYKYNLNNWRLVYYKFYNNVNNDTMMNIVNLGNVIVGGTYNGFFKFNGFSFDRFLTVKEFFNIPRFGGNNISDFITFEPYRDYYKLHHWNNANWSYEDFNVPYSPEAFFNINERIYFVYYHFDAKRSVIVKGKLKR